LGAFQVLGGSPGWRLSSQKNVLRSSGTKRYEAVRLRFRRFIWSKNDSQTVKLLGFTWTWFDRGETRANRSAVFASTELVAPVFKDQRRKDRARVPLEYRMARLAFTAPAPDAMAEDVKEPTPFLHHRLPLTAGLCKKF